MEPRIVFLLFVLVQQASSSLKGKLVSCEKEGQLMSPPPGTDSCIKCECRNKNVQCWKPKCPQSEGCHVLLPDKPKHSCCRQCRGCVLNGREMMHGDTTYSHDRCHVHTCRAGVVTVSAVKCHVPCANPVHVPGRCCPLCPVEDSTVNGGCFYEGEFVKNGSQVSRKEDKCTQCTCLDGQVSCSKPACPVLNCPESTMVRDEGSCCPRCEGSRQLDHLTHEDCVFRGKRFLNGSSATPDKCTACMCKDGSMVCDREVCPVLTCPSHAQIHEKESCCPKCPAAQSCTTEDGIVKKHAAEWRKHVCTTCSCFGGKVTCSTATCDESKPCPGNLVKTKLPGKCCSVCVQPDSKCTVSGSGTETLHVTTFDRKSYPHSGVCKYRMVSESQNHFSIRLKTGYKTPNTLTVKHIQLFLKTNNSMATVTMDTRLVAKLNKTVIKSGYKIPDMFALEKKDLSLTLTLLKFNVKVTLSADGYTEVVVSRDLQEMLSGLCGNYNELASDDLMTRDGQLTEDTGGFIEDWRVGGYCACDKKVPAAERHTTCSKNPERRLLARQRCDVIRGKTFKRCRKVVNVRPYYLTCLDNVCSCEKNPRSAPCHCPVIEALAAECRNYGSRVTNTPCSKSRDLSRPNKRLQHESKFIDSALTLALRTGQYSRKSKNKLKKARRKNANMSSEEIEKLKKELTKKHARKQKRKPRGPDDFLFG